MKIWLIRAAMLGGLAVFLLTVYVVLRPLGFSWVAWVLLGLVGLTVLIELGLRGRRRRGERGDWARWRAARFDAAARTSAIREVQRALGQARRLGSRARVRHTRFAVLLAELQLAHGQGERALETLAAVPLEALEPAAAAVARLARADAYLFLGDADAASVSLAALDRPLRDPALDASRELAEATVTLERDDAGDDALDDALSKTRDVEARAEPGDELHDLAVALELALLARLERAEEASLASSALRPEARAQLSIVGSRRIRAMLTELMAQSTDAETIDAQSTGTATNIGSSRDEGR